MIFIFLIALISQKAKASPPCYPQTVLSSHYLELSGQMNKISLQDPQTNQTEDPKLAHWFKFFNSLVMMDLCSALHIHLENLEYTVDDNQIKDPNHIKKFIDHVRNRPFPRFSSKINSRNNQIKPLGTARSPLEYADLCKQYHLENLRKIIQKHPELVTNLPPDEVLKNLNLAGIRKKYMTEVFLPLLAKGMPQERSLASFFWEELNRDWAHNFTLAYEGVKGTPRAVWQNIVGLKDFVVLAYNEPGKVKDGFVELYKSFSEDPGGTFLDMTLTDDPAQASAAVVEMFFGGKGTKFVMGKVSKKIREKIANNIRKSLQSKSFENILKAIPDANRRVELEELALKDPDRFVEELTSEVITRKLDEIVEAQVKDPELRKKFLTEIKNDPNMVVDNLANSALRSYFDAKFPGALTGAAIRELSPILSQEALKQGKKVYVAAFDLGNFKSINDVLGHGRGDDVIRAFVDSINESTRSFDVVGRVSRELTDEVVDVDILAKTARDGGDEFIITFIAPDKAQADAIMKRVLKSYNESELLDSVSKELIDKQLKGETTLVKQYFGDNWQKKLEGEISPGSAEYGLAEIDGNDLKKLADENVDVFESKLKKADLSLTEKKDATKATHKDVGRPMNTEGKDQ